MININDFDYFLPPNLIANKPATPRDFSKLLVYDTKSNKIFFDQFINLDKYLPKKSFLVLNNTKVIPARINLYRENGGKVTVLFLVNEISQSQNSKALPAGRQVKVQNYISKLKTKEYKIRGYVDRKIEIGDRLYFDSTRCIDTSKQEGSIFTFRLNFSYGELFQLLEKKGTMPIPLYIKNTPLDEHGLRKKYQTIFADIKGSAAAPTASLHFTNRLFSKLEKKGIEKYFITLHVGLGTFAPIDEKNIREKKLHNEFYEISDEMYRYIDTSKKKGYKLVAVGTTVARTIESISNLKFKIHNSELNSACPPLPSASGIGRREFLTLNSKLVNKTDLFIFPPYDFKMVDCLITNFHLPKSSLMMLVEAFLQYKKSRKSLIDLYKIAIKNNFRFYSFGDGMLIR